MRQRLVVSYCDAAVAVGSGDHYLLSDQIDCDNDLDEEISTETAALSSFENTPNVD